MWKTRKSKRRIRRLTYLAPRQRWIYRICKMYVDNYRGQNNADMLINGELLFLEHVIPQCQGTIFDIGAHHGDWTEAVLNILPDANVHSFEPTKHSYKKLLAKEFPPNVKLKNIGLSDKLEPLSMYVYPGKSQLNSVYHMVGHKHEATEEITVTTIDTYCQENQIEQIFLIKIDAEGHDLNILRGAQDMLRAQKVAIVQIEYGANWILAHRFLMELFVLADQVSYHIYRIMPFGLLRIPQYSYELENFENANYILIQSDFELPSELKILDNTL